MFPSFPFLSYYSQHNDSIKNVMFNREKLYILTNRSLTTYQVENGDELKKSTTEIIHHTLPIGCACIDGNFLLLDHCGMVTYYGRKPMKGNILVISDNEVYWDHHNHPFFTINKKQHVFHMNLNSQNSIDLYTINLIGTPILKSQRFIFTNDSCVVKSLDPKNVKLNQQHGVSCIFPKDEWIITGSNKLSFTSKLGITHSYSPSRGSKIVAIHAHNDLIIFSRIDQSLCLLKWNPHNIDQFDHYQQVNATTVFTNMVFYSSNRFLAYNKSHVPFIWCVKNYKLVELGPLDDTPFKMLGISSLLTHNKNTIALSQTDGYNSNVIFEKHFSVEAFPNAHRRQCLGPVSNRGLLYCLSNEKTRDVYEIRDYNGDLITTFGFKSILERAGVVNEMSILQISPSYIVAGRSIMSYIYHDSHELGIGIEIDNIWDYECYEIHSDQAVIYNDKFLGLIQNGIYKELARHLPFDKTSTITLSASWHNNSLKVHLGNLDQMFKITREEITQQSFNYSGNNVGILSAITDHNGKSIAVSEDFIIFQEFNVYLREIPYDFVKMFQTVHSDLIAITRCNKLVLFNVENGTCTDLNKKYQWGLVLNAFPQNYENNKISILLLETDLGLFSLDCKGGSYISPKIPDVISNFIELPGSRLAMIGTSSIHYICKFTGQIQTLSLKKKVLDYVVKNDEQSSASYIGLILEKANKYSISWFKSTLEGGLTSLKSKHIRSNSPIIVNKRGDFFFTGKWRNFQIENEVVKYETSIQEEENESCHKIISFTAVVFDYESFQLNVWRLINVDDDDILDLKIQNHYEEPPVVIDDSFVVWNIKSINNDVEYEPSDGFSSESE